MTNKESGKYIAQILSSHIQQLLRGIFFCTVEPRKELNDFEVGVIEEVSTWDTFLVYEPEYLRDLQNYLLEKKCTKN